MADTKLAVRASATPARKSGITGVPKAKFEQALAVARRARAALANVKDQSAEIGRRVVNGGAVVAGGVQAGILDSANDGKGFHPAGIPLTYMVGAAETAIGLAGSMFSKNPLLEALYYGGTGAIAYSAGNTVRGLITYRRATESDKAEKR